MFSTIGYACAAVILGVFALSTIAIDLHTVFRDARWNRTGPSTQQPRLRLVGGTSSDRSQNGDGVSQSAA